MDPGRPRAAGQEKGAGFQAEGAAQPQAWKVQDDVCRELSSDSSCSTSLPHLWAAAAPSAHPSLPSKGVWV